MYVWTGHALVDVGIAALVALAGCETPSALTTTDLTAVAGRLAAWYTQPGSTRNFAKGSVFHNAGYGMANPALQRKHVARVLNSWQRESAIDARCAFCGRPAAFFASRQDIPLLNGEAIYNFSARGVAGLPVCGLCSLAIQALPFGCVRSGGMLIACHSDDPTLTQALARTAVQRAERALTLGNELPVFACERTRFVELLIDWLALLERQQSAQGSEVALTGYVFTNAGASAAIRIYTLESSVIGFAEAAQHNADATLTQAWQGAMFRAWGRARAKHVASETMQRPNHLYEALLDLPAGARGFLYRFLFPTRHWGLVALFLRKVMKMDPTQIELLRSLGERFAAYVRERKRFFYPFARTAEYALWRRHVLNAADDCKRRSGHSLISFDEFIAAFTAPPGEINDWRLARDLIVLVILDAGIQADETLFEDEPEIIEEVKS